MPQSLRLTTNQGLYTFITTFEYTCLILATPRDRPAFQNGFSSPILQEVPFQDLNKIMSSVSSCHPALHFVQSQNRSVCVGGHFESRLCTMKSACFKWLFKNEPNPAFTKVSHPLVLHSTFCSNGQWSFPWFKYLIMSYVSHIKMKANHKHYQIQNSIPWEFGLSKSFLASQSCWIFISPGLSSEGVFWA